MSQAQNSAKALEKVHKAHVMLFLIALHGMGIIAACAIRGEHIAKSKVTGQKVAVTLVVQRMTG